MHFIEIQKINDLSKKDIIAISSVPLYENNKVKRRSINFIFGEVNEIRKENEVVLRFDINENKSNYIDVNNEILKKKKDFYLYKISE